MNYCIVNTNNIIENIIVCNSDEIAKQLNASPYYDGANIGDQYNPPFVKNSKIAEIKQACEDYIYAGTNVTYEDGTVEHFTYNLADQSNISEMFTAIMAGATEFPYHADGEICKVYTKAQIVTIYGTLSLFKAEATTYHNSLKAQVNAMTDDDEINAVQYHVTPLTGDYLDNYNAMMTSAQTQLNAILAKISSGETADA